MATQLALANSASLVAARRVASSGARPQPASKARPPSTPTAVSIRFLAVRSAVDGGPAPATSTVEGVSELELALAQKSSSGVAAALDAAKEAGKAKLWKSYPSAAWRRASVRELQQMGIKSAETLAVPSTRNEAAFLASVIVPSSLLAVVVGQLPGDWGFFSQYLIGSIGLVVLGIGSVAPGLLEVPISSFAPVFSDYKDRVLKHEAAHFLVAYLVGVPVSSYSLDIGKEHTNLIDEKLQRRIIEARLEPGELDKLAAVAMAGMAVEGLNYDQVMGQTADLISLQRLFNRAKPPLSVDQQKNITRWGVLYSTSLIKSHGKAFDALAVAMKAGASVEECILAIESA